MVGKQQLSPASGTLSLLGKVVPTTNFYRQLKQALELSFLYELVAPYYGKCGHQSIDPVLFFKLMLVEHLENLSSDRALIRHCQLRLDILFFLDHALDQPLPWHSTLSRTRQRLPDKVFDECFQYSLNQCAQTGLVDGQIQAIDAAYVEANASLDTLEAKKIANWTLDVNQEAVQPAPEKMSFVKAKQYVNPKRVARNNRTHQSLSDPQARLATKPGKPFRLFYSASMVVDTAQHVITHIQADAADEKDSRHLLTLVDRAATRLRTLGLPLRSVLADAGFGSGNNYAGLESRNIEGFVSLFGQYTPIREPFTYDPKEDVYRCSYGAVLKNHGLRMMGGYGNYYYFSKVSECKDCPIKVKCCGKKQRKRLLFTMYRNHYERMQKRLNSARGRRMKKLRSSTVEPVFGSLLNYFGLRRSNARGQSAAHKRMLMAATAYNLKKWLVKKGWPKAVTQVLALHPDNIFVSFILGIWKWVGLCNSHQRITQRY
jgi:transposase